jgi:hypothetical protein
MPDAIQHRLINIRIEDFPGIRQLNTGLVDFLFPAIQLACCLPVQP